MKRLKLTFDEKVFYAKLLEEDAPRTVQSVEENCPCECMVHHARICDNEVFFYVPFNADYWENPVYSEPGHIAFFNTRQTVCIWYDEMIPLGCCNQFAIMDPDTLREFAESARKTWSTPYMRIKMEVVEVNE